MPQWLSDQQSGPFVTGCPLREQSPQEQVAEQARVPQPFGHGVVEPGRQGSPWHASQAHEPLQPCVPPPQLPHGREPPGWQASGGTPLQSGSYPEQSAAHCCLPRLQRPHGLLLPAAQAQLFPSGGSVSAPGLSGERTSRGRSTRESPGQGVLPHPNAPSPEVRHVHSTPSQMRRAQSCSAAQQIGSDGQPGNRTQLG
jgi:hypothetical protein